jgi:Cu/Ag efflux protein CusF
VTRRSLLSLALAAGAACKSRQEDAAAGGQVNRYPLRGVVLSVDPARKTASIRHEEIPGFMEAMTMDFPVKNPGDLAKLTAGAAITATLCQRPSDFEYWIEDVRPAVSSR